MSEKSKNRPRKLIPALRRSCCNRYQLVRLDPFQTSSKAMEQEENLRLRILTLDPQSVFVNYRAKQLDETEVRIFRTELQGALDAVYFRLRRFERRVQIKTYDDFPSQIAFFFDQEILACVVSATGRSRDNCAFLLPSTFPGAKRSFTDHFSHLWSSETRSHTYKNEKQKD